MKTFSMVCVALVLCVTLAVGEDPTYAERLGWKAGDRVLILHVDDAGMSHDSDLGAIESIEKGVANSMSIMMPCPWVPEIVEYIKANPGVDAGLHLTLTAEWKKYRWGPVAGVLAVPGLVDEEGALWHTVRDVVKHATADEVETEIRAQVARARKMGFEPTHLDSHMGTLFATPEFAQRYIKVGIETGIPIMFPGGHNFFISKQNPAGAEQARETAKMIWAAGLPILDDLHNFSYNWKTTEKTERYIDAIKGLKPGVTMMIMHCTRPTEVFTEISDSGTTRLGDLNTMLDPKFRKALKKEKIILTTWRELKERRDALK